MAKEFKAEIKDGKLIIYATSEEKEYIGKDGKVHKDVIIHAPSLSLIADFKKKHGLEEVIVKKPGGKDNGKRDLQQVQSKPDEQGN